MANSLFPAFVRLFYHTAFGQHTMTLPTKEWDFSLGTNGKGGYINWGGSDVDAQDMVEAIVDELKDFQPASCIFDSAIIYNLADETAPALPRVSIDLGTSGVAVTSDVPASQSTMTARTGSFGIAKLVWFDATPSTDFLPQRSLPVSGQPLDLWNVWSSLSWAWSGRDNAKPEQFIQVSYTLNEALRRQYRLN